MKTKHGKLEDYPEFSDVEINACFRFTFRDRRVPKSMLDTLWKKTAIDTAVIILDSGTIATIHPQCEWKIYYQD